MYVWVTRLGDVDNLTSTFDAKVFIRLGWPVSKEVVRSTLQTRASTINTGLIMFRPWETFTFFNASEVEIEGDWANPQLCYWGSNDAKSKRFHLVTSGNINKLKVL